MKRDGYENYYPAGDFHVRVSQGECVMESFQMLGALTGVFNEIDMAKDKFGSTAEGNRVRVYTLSFTIAEAKS